MATNLEFFYTADRQEWRQWLANNHELSPGIFFVFYKKKTGQPSLTYGEAVEEALCYGWIDSLPCKIDDERHGLKFSPRKSRSVWSKPNKDRIERLMATGQIMPVGLAKIEAAKLDGSWDALNDSDNLVVPPDLETALQVNLSAHQNFHNFSPSSRKQILYWISSAKRTETRSARIEATVQQAALGKRANNQADTI